MRVRIVNRIHCPDHVHEPGQVTDVGDAIARQWIGQGDAVPADPRAESATPAKPENAAIKRGKRQ